MEDLLDETELLRQANAISDLSEACSLPQSVQCNGDARFYIFTKSAKDLSARLKLQMMCALETNMKSLYERTSWGWNDTELNKETFHSLNRFVLASTSADFSQIEQSLAGFAAFRFDWDDEDEPEFPVLYLYQLQILPQFQKSGLGRAVMDLVRAVSAQTKMRKILLTCFKINVDAMEFYKRIGFKIDKNSPSMCGYTGEPYEILSDS